MILTQADVTLILISVLLTFAMALPLRLGLFSIAPAAFAGIGAYVFGVLTVRYHVSPSAALVAAAGASIGISLLLAIPLGRIRGLYTSIATLAFIVIATGVESSLQITGGTLGMWGIPTIDTRLPLLGLLAFVVGSWIWLDRSSFGRRVDVVRFDPTVASVIGINVPFVRVMGLVGSGLLAGVVGAFYAYSFYFIAPANFDFFFAIKVSAYAIVGGSAHWAGPLIGALVLSGANAMTRSLANWGTIVTGLVMVAVVVLYPQGLGGGLRRAFRNRPLPFLGRRHHWPSPADVPAGEIVLLERASPQPKTPGPAIRVESLTKTFGGVTAVADVSFELQTRGVIGVIGPNGSGKSTLLGMLSGLVEPTSGRIFVGEADLTRSGARDFSRAGVGRTFQQVRLVPDLPIWENIAVGIRGVGDAELRKRVFMLAERLGIAGSLDAWPDEAPAALQRKAEVARALIAQPAIVLLDEPAAGLTEAEADDFGRMVLEVGRTSLVVIVEHNMQLVYDVAERVLVLLEGRLVGDGSPEAVGALPAVRAAYLGIA